MTRLEASDSATLATFPSGLIALRRTADVEVLLQQRRAEAIEQFLDDAEPACQRGRR